LRSRFSPLAVAAVLAAGCSERVLVVVDPDPCLGVEAGVPGCPPPGPLDDLVGYWRLDDGAGSTTARDLSGYGNDGTLVNLGPATAWVAGRAAGGLAVEAAGFVNVDPSASIDSITDQVTLAAWVYLEGTIVDYGTAASREIGNGIDQYYHVSLNSMESPNLFITTDEGTARLASSTAVTRQTWVHIAGTYDGATARLYVDGREVMSQGLGGRFPADTTPLIIGGNGNGAPGAPTELFPGRIDEIMLYRRALDADAIAALHAGALFAASATALDAGARD
jgi:hypothetical protein